MTDTGVLEVATLSWKNRTAIQKQRNLVHDPVFDKALGRKEHAIPHQATNQQLHPHLSEQTTQLVLSFDTQNTHLNSAMCRAR